MTEKQTKKLIHKMESDMSHYHLKGQLVFVNASYYPKKQFWIQDCVITSEKHEHVNRRRLTDEIKSQLEDWLSD